MKEFPPPNVDGRRRTDLRETAIEQARNYTSELDPDADDVGTALLGLFAEIAEDVTAQLDRTPEKNRVAFFDKLGFDRNPPQPARLPLVFQVAEGLPENVTIPSGMQAVSEPEGDEAEQAFEIADGEGFEATPSRLQEVYSTHPDGDAIFAHQSGPQTGLEPRLFSGENRQSHVLYLGHTDFFSLKREENGDSDGAAEFDVRIDAPKEGDVFERLRWSYYGTRDIDGESIEGWHLLGLRPPSTAERKTAGSGQTILRFTLPAGGEFAETTLPEADPNAADEATPASEAPPSPPPAVTEVTSKWIKCEPPSDGLPEGLFDVRVNSVSLTLPGLSGDIKTDNLKGIINPDSPDSPDRSELGSLGAAPDTLLANDVPLPTKKEARATNGDSKKLYPFGGVPRPLDAFYIGSQNVLTKKGQRILLVFPGMEDGLTQEAKDMGIDPGDNQPSLDLSWEYWNGNGWDYLPNVEDHFTEGGWVTFDLPTDADGTTVAGHESHWIRVRVLEDGYVRYEENDENSNIWEMIAEVVPRFDEVRLFYVGGPSDERLDSPDSQPGDSGPERPSPEAARAVVSTPPEHVAAYNNLSYGEDVAGRLRGRTPAKGDRRFAPFTRIPDEKQTVYLGFDKALDDGPIQVLFSAEDKAFPSAFYPRARWEYCDDPATDSWTQLSVEDETESLTRRGIVGLVFPEATTSFERFGRERHWIRVRLIGDQFLSTDGTVLERDGSGITISEIDAENERVVLRNTSSQAVDLTGYKLDVEYRQPAKQVRALPTGSTVPPGGSLVVGTGRKTKGPSDVTLGYRTWVLNNVDPDAVALLTPDGRFVTALKDEGDHDHATDAGGVSARRRPSVDEILPCGAMEPLVLATSPMPTEEPPLLRGIYANAGWADNVRTVADESLGSSDGSPGQEFSFVNQPVIEETIWVEELSALDENARAALKREHPERVEERTDEAGDVTAFWVRWMPVENFIGSPADARHYVVDRVAGKITFGDGTAGSIPPRGEENIRASYRTGGGVDGNVQEGAVIELTSAPPFVEGVTNPEPGGGGADAERTAETLRRASRTLKDRDRAVTEADFERLAMAASRELARVRCIPRMDRAGTTRTGWVTVLLVPRTSTPKPMPSPEVKDRVESTLRRAAPASLTELSPRRIVVRGPSYVEVVVDTDLVVDDDVSSIATVEEAAINRLAAFLHPLTGGSDETGWKFGELPCVSDFYALLERVEGVDHVERLEVTFRGRERGRTVTDDDRLPEVTADTLVYSGSHEVRAKGETTGVTDAIERTA